MPTKLTRYILSFSDAQIEDLRRRFPAAENDKAAIYEALGFEPPKHGGPREGAGQKPKGRRTRRAHKAGKPRGSKP